MIDLVVAGGGPVGLATAICAVTAGMSVVVVEPRARPIDKACGEGLMPEALVHLRRLGVDPPGATLEGIRYLAGSHVAEARFRREPGRGVRRTVLHDAMRRRALDLGVGFRQGKVTQVEQDRAGVRAAGLRADFLIGADGLHSAVRKAVGLEPPAGQGRRSARRFGVRQHFRVCPWTAMVEVHWLPRNEVYVTPISHNEVGVALLGPRPLRLEAAVASLPTLARHLTGSAPASSPLGAGPLRQSTRARVAGRCLLVGDAAGYVDALTGEGLRVGFAQAQAAVDALTRGEPQAYEADWRRITRSYRGLTNALVWVGGRPTLRPMIVPAARALPGAFTRIVDVIAG